MRSVAPCAPPAQAAAVQFAVELPHPIPPSPLPALQSCIHHAHHAPLHLHRSMQFVAPCATRTSCCRATCRPPPHTHHQNLPPFNYKSSRSAHVPFHTTPSTLGQRLLTSLNATAMTSIRSAACSATLRDLLTTGSPEEAGELRLAAFAMRLRLRPLRGGGRLRGPTRGARSVHYSGRRRFAPA